MTYLRYMFVSLLQTVAAADIILPCAVSAQLLLCSYILHANGYTSTYFMYDICNARFQDQVQRLLSA